LLFGGKESLVANAPADDIATITARMKAMNRVMANLREAAGRTPPTTIGPNANRGAE
jgi:hypothetical protein